MCLANKSRYLFKCDVNCVINVFAHMNVRKLGKYKESKNLQQHTRLLGMAVFSDVRLFLIYGVSIVLGLSKGSKAVFQSLIIPKYVSLEKLPAATGLSMILNGMLGLIIGPIIGK